LHEVLCWLRQARQPLILIGDRVSWEAQRAAVRLGKLRQACIDTPASARGAERVRATAEAGLFACTLGEIRSQADRLLFWDFDQHQSQPRFWERYIQGFAGRMIGVNSRLPNTGRVSQEHVSLEPRSKGQFIDQLRLLSKGISSNATPAAQAVFAELRAAHYGILILGEREQPSGEAAWGQWQALLQGLSEPGRRWFTIQLEQGANRSGAREALLSETGYPCAVRCRLEGCDLSLDEWSAESLLLRHEADLVLQIGGVDWLSPPAYDRLSRIKTVVFGPARPRFAPAAWLPVAAFGIQSGGHALRMDGVPVPVPSILTSRRPALETVLNGLIEAIQC
jgi:formylmethanofuran dehydrogenase subunit B